MAAILCGDVPATDSDYQLALPDRKWEVTVQVIRENAAPGLTTTPQAHTWRARIIEGDRWGSSGYYPRTVLETDGPGTWPTGTPIYFDHPTPTEEAERPVRSVKDLAGKIASTPVYENDGLYADVEFYAHTAHIVEAMANDIGLSIRASAEVESGEADGRQGWIITSLSEGLSVDLVTKAGAGGKLVTLLESAQAQARAVEALPGGLTYDQVRDLLRDAVKSQSGDGYQWVEDFTDTEVIYQVETDSQPTRWFRQPYTLTTGDTLTLATERIEVRPRTVYEPVATDAAQASPNVPADPAGQPQPATESERNNNMATIQIEETAHAALVEKAGRVEALETQLSTVTEERNKAVQAVVESQQATDRAKAEAIIAAAEGYVFNDLEKSGLLASLPKVEETGRLDTDAFTKTVTEAAAKRAAEHGAGRPFGAPTTHNSGGMTLEDFDKALDQIRKGA